MATKKIPPTLVAFNSLPDEALIDVRFVAVLFDCSDNTVWRRVKSGMLPSPIRVSPQQTRWRVGGIRKVLASLDNCQGPA
ncbi:helix-turn-helix transcriptional regulator [Propionivibrio sp.]|uniref:helix-turn-helix transcriptional regulator n=1 Tax=Propionivibrio sp. TaxID=2212460 RepID=UPI0039E48490